MSNIPPAHKVNTFACWQVSNIKLAKTRNTGGFKNSSRPSSTVSKNRKTASSGRNSLRLGWSALAQRAYSEYWRSTCGAN